MTITTMIITLAILLIFGIIMYAVLDGFDLGIGNQYLAFDKKDRGKLMDVIAPVWDANETWLVYLGTVGVAAFPILYYGILPSLYIPAILMVAGLFIRGLSIEFKIKSTGRDGLLWDFTFFLGSVITSFFQGVLFASAFLGLNIKDGMYQGGSFDFINPFSFVSGILTFVVYSVLGLAFIRYKAKGEVAELATKKIKPLLVISFVSTFAMEYWLLNRTSGLKEYFLSDAYKLPIYSTLSVLSVIVFFVILKLLKNPTHDGKTFLATTMLFVISLIKKVVIVFPFLIFPHHTIFTSANSGTSLKFTLVILIIFLPIVIGCTIFSYYSFRGKLKDDERLYG